MICHDTLFYLYLQLPMTYKMNDRKCGTVKFKVKFPFSWIVKDAIEDCRTAGVNDSGMFHNSQYDCFGRQIGLFYILPTNVL